jgi:hypothetical protein
MTYVLERLQIRGTVSPSVIFLAEGDTEKYFLDSYLSHTAVDLNRASIACLQGITNLRAKLSILAKEENFTHVRSVGFLVDADTDASARCTSVHQACVASGFANSLTPSKQTTSTCAWEDANNGLRVYVLTLPGKSSNSGTIEDLIVREIETNSADTCLKEADLCLRRSGTGYTKRAWSKHSYLSKMIDCVVLVVLFKLKY